MKKIAALFTAALSVITTAWLTVGASATESAPETKKPLLEDFMSKNGTWIFLAAVGIFAVIALIALISSFVKTRRKYKRIMDEKRRFEEFTKNGNKKETEKETKAEPVADQKAEPVVVQPNNYYYYDYRYYNNGEQVPYGTGEYKELATEAIRVPERRLAEVPTMRASSNGAIAPRPIKPTAPVIPVKPVVARDLAVEDAQEGAPEQVVTICDEKKATKTKIIAAVALTAVGCHVLHKLYK